MARAGKVLGGLGVAGATLITCLAADARAVGNGHEDGDMPLWKSGAVQNTFLPAASLPAAPPADVSDCL